MKTISVFGIGYVGCVSAACLARDGFRVIGVDIDRNKVGMMNGGTSPVNEPGLDKLVAAQVESGRLSATADPHRAIDKSDMAVIAVGTPSGLDGSVSTTAVERCVATIGRSLSRHDQEQGAGKAFAVVVRSTLMPGILEDRLAPLLEETSGRSLGDGLELFNHPEFLRESSAIADYDDPPMILVGTLGVSSAAEVIDLYPHTVAKTFVTDSRTAALVKYASNAFHAVKIAFANEIGALAKSLGADGRQVMKLVTEDDKLNISKAYLRPGFAFGGSCLPKDVRAMARHAQREALDLRLLRSVLPSNQSHLERAVAIIERSGCREIGLVGLSFKAGTDDLRESPYVTLVETLIGRGYDVRIYDPAVQLSRLHGGNLAYIDQRLPHLAALLVDSPQALYEHASLLVLGSDVARDLPITEQFNGRVIDLRSDLVRSKASDMVETQIS